MKNAFEQIAEGVKLVMDNAPNGPGNVDIGPIHPTIATGELADKEEVMSLEEFERRRKKP